MNQLRNHPAFNLYGLENPVIIVIEPMEKLYTPSEEQAMKSTRDIYNLDLNCDWNVYEGFYKHYFNTENIVLLPSCTDEVISDYFNASKLSDDKIREFFHTYTSTYFKSSELSKEEKQDAIEDENQRQYYFNGTI